MTQVNTPVPARWISQSGIWAGVAGGWAVTLLSTLPSLELHESVACYVHAFLQPASVTLISPALHTHMPCLWVLLVPKSHSRTVTSLRGLISPCCDQLYRSGPSSVKGSPQVPSSRLFPWHHAMTSVAGRVASCQCHKLC